MSESLAELLSQEGLAVLPLTLHAATRVARGELTTARQFESPHYRTRRYRGAAPYRPVSQCIPLHAVPARRPTGETR